MGEGGTLPICIVWPPSTASRLKKTLAVISCMHWYANVDSLCFSSATISLSKIPGLTIICESVVTKVFEGKMKIPRLWAQDFLAIFQISELDTTTTHNNSSDEVWVGSGSGSTFLGRVRLRDQYFGVLGFYSQNLRSGLVWVLLFGVGSEMLTMSGLFPSGFRVSGSWLHH